MPLNVDIAFRWGKKKKPSNDDATDTSSSLSSCLDSDSSTSSIVSSTQTTQTSISPLTNGISMQSGETDTSQGTSDTQEDEMIKRKMTMRSKGRKSKDRTSADETQDSLETQKSPMKSTRSEDGEEFSGSSEAKREGSTLSSSLSTQASASPLGKVSLQSRSGEEPNTVDDTLKTVEEDRNKRPKAKRSKSRRKSKVRTSVERTQESVYEKTPKKGRKRTKHDEDDRELLSQAGESKAKAKKAKKKAKQAETSLNPVSSQRGLILMRHAERVDRVFPTWLRPTLRLGQYKPYNLNIPSALPKRRGGVRSFELDPPITEVGRILAQLSAKSMRRMKIPISAVFCSPALRSVQTAQEIVREVGIPNLTVRIEPGLFDWCGWYEIFPLFMTNEEIEEMGVKIDKKYTPAMTREQIRKLRSETKHEYYRRAQNVIARLLAISHGTILVIGHAATVDASVRPLLDLPRSVPAFRHLDTLGSRFPYCASVVLDQTKETGQWVLGQPLIPTTFIASTSKTDMKFLLRH